MSRPGESLSEAVKDFDARALKAYLIWCCEMQITPGIVSLETWKRTAHYPI